MYECTSCSATHRTHSQATDWPYWFQVYGGCVMVSLCDFKVRISLITNNTVHPFICLFTIYFGRLWKPQTISRITERRGLKKGIPQSFLWAPELNPEMHTCGCDSKQYTKSTEPHRTGHLLSMSQMGPGWYTHRTDLNRQNLRNLRKLNWYWNHSPQKVSQNLQNLTGPFTARTNKKKTKLFFNDL